MTAASSSHRPTALFVCGSLNQTTQLEAVARHLADFDCWFSPFYGGEFMRVMRALGVLEPTIGGRKLGDRCLAYLNQRGLPVDFRGRRGVYDLYVLSTDIVVPPNALGRPTVVVQEGIMDPDGLLFELVRRFPRWIPRWLSGTSATGLSGSYDKFCVASAGYVDYFAKRGVPREKMVVTGMPNFDDCAAFYDNDFPHRDYVLICSSDTRETVKFDSRSAFIRWALEHVRGRPVVIKLHPNENVARATREYRQAFPSALIFDRGNTDAMIANAAAVITQYSSTVFVALALGKEVYSYHSIQDLEALVPEQNRCAARNIAAVCREVLHARSGAPFTHRDTSKEPVSHGVWEAAR